MRERPATRGDLAAVLDLFCRYEELFRGFAGSDAGDITDDWDRDDGDFARTASCWRTTAASSATRWCPTSTPTPSSTPTGATGRWPSGCSPSSRRTTATSSARRAGRRLRHERGPARPGRDAGPALLAHAHRVRRAGPGPERRGHLLDTDRFDADLYLVAEAGGEVVGACLSQVAPGEGFVRQLAVAPAQRGRGLGLALLRESFRRHVARGCPASILGVDAGNPTGALVLYEKAGMQVHDQFTRWDWP